MYKSHKRLHTVRLMVVGIIAGSRMRLNFAGLVQFYTYMKLVKQRFYKCLPQQRYTQFRCFFLVFKVHPQSNENYRIVKFCENLSKVYKKYQNDSWHIQIVVRVGTSQKPRKSKMSPGERRRGKRLILAFHAEGKNIPGSF